MSRKNIDDFEFRTIRPDEAEQAVKIEQTCFPPDEACPAESIIGKAVVAPELFLVAVDRKTGRLAGFLNGIATDEEIFRDEFLADASLHDPEGKNIMLLGLEVLPEYEHRGLAHEMVKIYIEKEHENGRKKLILTCLDSKVPFYEGMGFKYIGVSASVWGNREWHDMVLEY